MYSPLTLAYIGDAAYEIVIRTILVRKANMQVNKLHRHAAGLVKAEKQRLQNFNHRRLFLRLYKPCRMAVQLLTCIFAFRTRIVRMTISYAASPM